MQSLKEISQEIIKDQQCIEFVKLDNVVEDGCFFSQEPKKLEKTGYYSSLKRKHLWKLEIEGIDSFLVKSCSGPAYTRESADVHTLDGKHSVVNNYMVAERLRVELFDAIAPSGAQQIMEWIGDGTNFSKRDARLYRYDSNGNVIGDWEIRGLFPVSVRFGDLDYSSSEASIIDVEFMVDYYHLNY